jgi:hypothetical protein
MPDVKAPNGASAVVMSHVSGNEDPEETAFFERNKKNVNRIAPPSERRDNARIDLARDVKDMIEKSDLSPDVKKTLKAKAEIYKQRAENPALFEEEKAGFLGEESTLKQDGPTTGDLVESLLNAGVKNVATVFDPRVHGSEVLDQLSGLVKLLEKKAEELDAARQRGAKVAEDLLPKKKSFGPKNAIFTGGEVQEMDLSADEDVREIGLKGTPLHQDTAYSKKTAHRKSLNKNTFRRVK